MIKTWANRASERFYVEGKSSPFRGLDLEAAQDLIAALDAVRSPHDLSPLKSVGLYKLKGDRAGKWAMTVNEGGASVFGLKTVTPTMWRSLIITVDNVVLVGVPT